MTTEKFGAKGEWWVIAQFILIGIALMLNVVFRDSAPTNGGLRFVITALALICILGGALMLFGGAFGLGSNLTALPRPVETGRLVQSGMYAIVRHPIYAGIIIGMLGVALFFSNWIGILCALALLLFFDRKSRREEIWLTEKYAEYSSYQLKVRKLIPFIY